MGKRKDQGKLPLFDLPLNADADSSPEPAWDAALTDATAAPAAETPGAEAPGAGDPPPAAAREAGPEPAAAESPEPAADSAAEAPTERGTRARRATDGAAGEAGLRDRLLAGLADLAVQLVMLGLAVTATHALAVTVTIDDWMPFGVLMLVFSFLYWVVPLAFWGQTPGMAWVGHTARTLSDEPLTFAQTFLRWVGALLTLALAGLPLLLALTGRSLTDRISDSKTVAD